MAKSTLISHDFRYPYDEGNGRSTLKQISADGTKIVFESDATNLLATDPESYGSQVYLYDALSDCVTLLSHNVKDPILRSDGWVSDPFITADGTKVMFCSSAKDLTDIMPERDRERVYSYDIATGVNELVCSPPFEISVVMDVSSDGSMIAFQAPADEPARDGCDECWSQIYLYDVANGSFTLVSHDAHDPVVNGEDRSYSPMISPDGSKVLFRSTSRNLVADDPGGRGEFQTYLYDVASDANMLMFREAPEQWISDKNWWTSDVQFTFGGTKIIFTVHVRTGNRSSVGWMCLYDIASGQTTPILGTDFESENHLYSSILSGDGSKVAWWDGEQVYIREIRDISDISDYEHTFSERVKEKLKRVKKIDFKARNDARRKNQMTTADMIFSGVLMSGTREEILSGTATLGGPLKYTYIDEGTKRGKSLEIECSRYSLSCGVHVEEPACVRFFGPEHTFNLDPDKYAPDAFLLYRARYIARWIYPLRTTVLRGERKDLAGKPCLEQLEAIVDLCEGTDAKMTAWLHDVIENNDVCTPEYLLNYMHEVGIPGHVIEAVQLLNYDKQASYDDYLRAIKQNPLALEVLRVVIKHDLQSECLTMLPEAERKELLEKIFGRSPEERPVTAFRP